MKNIMIKRVFSWLWAKKWWVFTGLVLLIGGGYYAWTMWLKPADRSDFVSMDHTVELGSISNSLSLAGTTKFANAQKLTFVQKGKVTRVNVKVGDVVKKDQILATINADDLDQKVEKAKRDLKKAQRQLTTYMETSDKNLDLLKAQADLDSLLLEQTLLPQTQTLELQEAETKVKEQETSLKEAQADLDALIGGKKGVSNPDLALSDAIRNRNEKFRELVRGFRTQALKLEDLLDKYDEFMQETSKFENPEDYIHHYIGANNLAKRAASLNAFYALQKYVQQLQDLYAQYSKLSVESLTEDQMLASYQIFKTLGAEFTAWGTLNYEMINESVPYGEKLTKALIAGYATKFGTEYENAGYDFTQIYTNAVSVLKGIKNSDTDQENLETKVAKLTIELERAKNELKTKKQQHVVATAELAQKILKAKESVATLSSDVENPEEFQNLKDAVDTAQEELANYVKQYEDYRIIANFDGVVTKVEMQVGDSISVGSTSSDTEKYIYVETPNLLQVDLDVDQIDIVKIAVGMPVQVVLDALSEETFTGVISEIDTMSDSSTYKAKVVFQKKSADQKILGGMSASVKVVLEEANDVVVVPSPAIADSEKGEKIVKLQKGNQWIDQVVEVGISDDSNTQIISGLKEGDLIKGLYINDVSMQNLGVGSESSTFMMDRGPRGEGGPRG